MYVNWLIYKITVIDCIWLVGSVMFFPKSPRGELWMKRFRMVLSLIALIGITTLVWRLV